MQGIGHVTQQVVDARAAGGVRRQKLRRRSTAGLFHVLPKLNTLPRVETSIGHEVETDDVRFGLVAAAVGQENANLRTETEGLHGHGVQITRPGRDGKSDVGELLLRHTLVAMLGQHMTDLVTQYRGQLVLILGNLQHARVDAHLAARQGECIGVFVLEHDDLPMGTLVRQFVDDGGRDAAHVVIDCGIRFHGQL